MNRNKFKRRTASARHRWIDRCRCCVLLGALLGLPAAAAETTTGHDLLARCRDVKQPGACYNELIVVADMHDVVAAWGIDSAHWCMPEGVAPARLREVVLAWLEDPARAPKALDAPSTRLVAAAYAAAFPCGQPD